MDHHEPAERERSEPCSARTNPFTDDEENTSRKRQRTANGGSRSRSVDTTRDLDLATDPTSTRVGNDKAEPPHTPPHMHPEPPHEPTSSRVTINLRTNRPLEPILSSPSSPSTMMHGGNASGTRISVESESDALTTVPPIETPSSSPSATGSPQVELVPMVEDDSDFDSRDPPLAIIGDDEVYLDPMLEFPYCTANETLVQTVNKVAHYLQYDEVNDQSCFCRIRDWIDKYLKYASDPKTFYEAYIKYRDVWIQFPELVWALSRRSRFFGQFLNRSRDGRSALSEMLSQFARLAGRFLTMDAWSLEHYAKQSNPEHSPQLASHRYLAAYSFLLRKEEGSHIGRNLETHYNWNWDDDVAMLVDSFQAEGGTIKNLMRLVEGQSTLIERIPKLADQFTEPCRIASKIVNEARYLPEERDAHFPQSIEAAQLTLIQGYDFFKIMSACLEFIIEKHVTHISPDSTVVHLNNLTAIYRNSLMLPGENPKPHAIIDQFMTDNPTILRKQVVRAISYEWKFTVLKKLIISAQMQLRVIGVTTMCADLLALYGQDKAIEPSVNPLLLFFADFVLQNQLVDYIVGIGSHPELINESSNIVGFLIVTKTYNSQQTDKIWQTVMRSQDSRVVEAIVRMVLRCLNLFDYQNLLYLCNKVSEVPLGAFTATMRDFCQKLFHDLAAKAGPEGVGYMRTPPYDLCVRLIRESSITTSEAPLGYPDIQNFAATQLQNLLPYGPPSDGRLAIYLSCIQDVASRTPTAPGSISVINILLRRYIGHDLRILTTERDLTKLMVEEMEFTVIGGGHPIDQSTKISQASHARRELLLMIISHEPGTISPELGKRLWNVLVGSESKTATGRDTSWHILNSALKKSANNVFLATCFREHFPNLPPQCFTSGSLEFVREAIFSWMEEVRRNFVEEDRKFECQALDQLWRMILTAPPNNVIDAQAISVLVEVYVGSGLITSLPRAKSRTIHLALVERCLDQLKGAAIKLKAYSDGASSGSEEGMVIVASEDQFQEQEKIFARSLAVLREFLSAYQQKPQFTTPKPKPLVMAASDNVEGEPLIFKYQSFDGNKHTEVKSLTMGKLNTAASLLASLQKATGFKSYKIYCDGREFDPDEVEVCKSLDDLNLKGLVLVQRREDLEGSPGQSTGKASLESEIMKHFDDLWGYLSMHDKVAQEIYQFLVKFPVYGRLLADLETDSTPYSEIFLSGQPYKSLYAIHVLQHSIIESPQNGNASESSLTRAISLIVAALSDRAVFTNCPTDDTRDFLALHFVNCLVHFLNVPSLPTSIGPLLDDGLLGRLLEYMSDANKVMGLSNSLHLTYRSFEAMLEASLHSTGFWKSFHSHLKSSTLLRDLLLENPEPMIRKSVTKHIVNRCNLTPSLARISATELTVAFWPMISALIDDAVRLPQHCEDVFALSLELFKKLGENPLQFQSLDDLVKHWGGLLLSHSCNERIGYPESIDKVAQGLANLLCCASQFLKASEQTLSCRAVGTELFRRHLFPELSVIEDDELIILPIIPMLNPVTRTILSETIFNLVKDDETQYKEILTSLSTLVPYAAVEDGPYVYDLGFFFDRAKSIRSLTGYVGLRNLSNTCYLNSLFTQLFMNVPFRNFMLNSRVTEGYGGNQQKLLSETQNLFSYMQNSLRRFVDPTNLANSIETYDNSSIDVSIQMDVDEFYNLLFDRWEGQILSEDAKQQFKSFYGGQLVQQVKSKECPHISEREESFSAIQCDIKGKASLEESLQAYVEGEVMEGDNKYKCSTCDRHVDAVKRACLKDIPDNLIFHLKRFDFNLRTLQRSKINDYFAFPRSIDMRPYKVEHLMDTPDETPGDMFELVGVLVHSGTAESGHYYSFIRERPSNSTKENWVEFNDELVSSWDAGNLDASCFGGTEFRGTVNGDLQYDKSYSAYMLFYQRSSVLAQQKQAQETSELASPVRLEIPSRLANHIAMENELLMRKYCLYDPSHTSFVAKMLLNIQKINKGHCSPTHGLEKLALTSALNHLDQVVARTKDLPHFKVFLDAIEEVCDRCAECSRDYLEWYCDCPETLRHLLLRNPDGEVRTRIYESIINALNKVKVDASYAYGFGDDDDSADELDGGDPQLIQRVVKCILKLWDVFHTNCRAWPEYFGLLFEIAKMGDLESALLLDHGFLIKTLEIISADQLLPLGQQYTRMLNIISKRTATKPVSFDAVIALLCKLLQTCDMSIDSDTDEMNRLQIAINREPIPLVSAERHLLSQHWTRNEAHILTEKLLQINQNDSATRAIIITLLEWQYNVDHNVRQAINHGIRKGASTVYSSPFLKAALIYCEHSEDDKAIPFMIQHVAKAAYHVDNAEGRELLEFFKDILDIPSNKSNTPKEDIAKFVYENVNLWGPGLLTYYDTVVRNDTENFIRYTILGHGPDVDFGPADENDERADIIIQAAKKLGVACLEFIQETYIRQRVQAVRSTMMNIQDVTNACASWFDDDAKDSLSRRFHDLQSTVLPALRKCIVEEADDETSEWENSDGDGGYSSEPMGSIGPVNDDLNDADVQL